VMLGSISGATYRYVVRGSESEIAKHFSVRMSALAETLEP